MLFCTFARLYDLDNWRALILKPHAFRSGSSLFPCLTFQCERRGQSWTLIPLLAPHSTSCLQVPMKEPRRDWGVLHNPDSPPSHMLWHVSGFTHIPSGGGRTLTWSLWHIVNTHTGDSPEGRCCWRSTGYACPSPWRRWVSTFCLVLNLKLDCWHICKTSGCDAPPHVAQHVVRQGPGELQRLHFLRNVDSFWTHQRWPYKTLNKHKNMCITQLTLSSSQQEVWCHFICRPSTLYTRTHACKFS